MLWRPLAATPLLELLALESGNGMAVIVRTRAHVAVVDTGDTWQSRGAASAQRLVPALRALGVTAVDVVILGRPTPDRGAGVAKLTAVLPVARWVAPPGWQPGPTAWQTCRRQSWRWDGVTFQLWPAGGSCALHVSVAGRDAWLLATLSAADEAVLADMLGGAAPGRMRRADLAVLRRGAIRAQGQGPVWRALQPWRVIAAGHGTQDPARAEPIWRTGEEGAVLVHVTQNAQIVIQSERRRSWAWPWRRSGA